MTRIRQLSPVDTATVDELWRAAIDARRRAVGLDPLDDSKLILQRPGVFGVGAIEGSTLVAIAVGMPARQDDGRSERVVPGLAHISSVATHPDWWGRGLGGHCVQAILIQASRRGYARLQLWTHCSNPGAARLYERAGFVDTGRRKDDVNGEPIRHYTLEAPSLPLVNRPAARLLCLDHRDRVLLFRWRDPVDGFEFWEPPGGGIEVGETPYDAVLREWREETGLPTPEVTREPTLVPRDTVWMGHRSVAEEVFFLGRTTTAGTPSPDQATVAEQEAYLGHAWLSERELADLPDPVDPDVVPILQRLDSSRRKATSQAP